MREAKNPEQGTSTSSQNWMTKPVEKWTFNDFLQAKAYWEEEKEVTLRRSFINESEEIGELIDLDQLKQLYERVTILEDE